MHVCIYTRIKEKYIKCIYILYEQKKNFPAGTKI